MTKKFLSILLFFIFVYHNTQEKAYTLIDSKTKEKIIKKDSLSATKFLDSLSEHRFLLTKLIKIEENNNNNIYIYYDKGIDFNQVNVQFSDIIVNDLNLRKELFINNLDSLKQSLNEKYRQKGFPFNRVKTKFLMIENSIPKVYISIILGHKRYIDGFKIKGYKKIPTRFIKTLNQDFIGKTYDDKNILAIHNRLKNHPFISLERSPQTLFSKDSTQVFLFLQKKKANSFDGVLGFGNNSSEKISLNGSINLNFQNTFNSFERINIFWQRSPNKAQNFDLQTDIPYILQSNIGTNFQVNIHRQDSTFANVKIHPSAYYHLSSLQKLGIRGHFEIASTLNEHSLAKNFNRTGAGMWYDFIQTSDLELMLYKTRLRAEINTFATTYNSEEKKHFQWQYFVFAEHNFHLLGHHYLNIKGETAAIKSKNILSVNELLRFGGWNSFRGFGEQSLLGNSYAFGGVEYRYLIGKQAFFDIFSQVGIFENKALSIAPKLYNIGIGFNFILPIGLMSFQVSNGTTFGTAFQLKETKIHWGILTRF